MGHLYFYKISFLSLAQNKDESKVVERHEAGACARWNQLFTNIYYVITSSTSG